MDKISRMTLIAVVITVCAIAILTLSSKINSNDNVNNTLTDTNTTLEISSSTNNNSSIDKVTFRNPVTIMLMDDKGNVLNTAVVHNTITDDGINYILDAFAGGDNVQIKPFNAMAFIRDRGDYFELVSDDVFKITSNDTLIQTLDVDGQGLIDCEPGKGRYYYDPNITIADCTGIFYFKPSYRPDTEDPNRRLNLADDVRLWLGHMPPSANFEDFIPYFEITSLDEGVPLTSGRGAIYHNVAIGWGVIIEPST